MHGLTSEQRRLLLNALGHYLSDHDGDHLADEIEATRELRDQLAEEQLDAGEACDEDDGQPDSLQEHQDFAHDDDFSQGFDQGGWDE